MKLIVMALALLFIWIAPSWGSTSEQVLVEPTVLFSETRPANPDNYQLVWTDPTAGQLAITNSGEEAFLPPCSLSAGTHILTATAYSKADIEFQTPLGNQQVTITLIDDCA